MRKLECVTCEVQDYLTQTARTASKKGQHLRLSGALELKTVVHGAIGVSTAKIQHLVPKLAGSCPEMDYYLLNIEQAVRRS